MTDAARTDLRTVAQARAWNAVGFLATLALTIAILVFAPTAVDRATAAVPAAFLVVSWIVLRRDPTHVEGRIVLLTALAWGVAMVNPFEGSWVLPVGLMGTHLLLRYPDGTLPSPRWRWFSRACTVMIVGLALLVTVASEHRQSGGPNPYYVPWTTNATILLAFLPVGLVGGVSSLFVRYRRAAIVERTQIRWLAAAAAGIVVLYTVTFVTSFGYDAMREIDSTQSAWFAPADPLWLTSLQMITLFSFVLVPVAFGIAITRYHLYDIDRLISRTTSYALVTGMLLATYALVVTVVLRVLPESSNLAVATATLTAAALARPAVQRTQRVVDRRFDRTRYDQAKTAQSFGDLMRTTVHPDAVSEELLGAVSRNLQPIHLTLWSS